MPLSLFAVATALLLTAEIGYAQGQGLGSLARGASRPDFVMDFIEHRGGKWREGSVALRSAETPLDDRLRIRIDIRDPIVRNWRYRELQVGGRVHLVDRGPKVFEVDAVPSPLMRALAVFDPHSDLLSRSRVKRQTAGRRIEVSVAPPTDVGLDRIEYAFQAGQLREIRTHGGGNTIRYVITTTRRDPLPKSMFSFWAPGLIKQGYIHRPLTRKTLARDPLERIARKAPYQDLSIEFVERGGAVKRVGVISIRSRKSGFDSGVRIRIDYRDSPGGRRIETEVLARGTITKLDRRKREFEVNAKPSPLMRALAVFDPAQTTFKTNGLPPVSNSGEKTVVLHPVVKLPSLQRLKLVFTDGKLTALSIIGKGSVRQYDLSRWSVVRLHQRWSSVPADYSRR